jgi:uridine kinase
MKVPVFGISGCTCSGKTSVVQMLTDVFPKAVIFNQDNYYFPVDDKRLSISIGFIRL